VLAAVCRDTPLEFELSRAHAMCCGAGGGRFWMEEHIGKRINITRVEQALPRQPKTIATACPYCTTMIRDATSQLGKDETIATRDLAELVAEAIETPAAR
jgi:Fe-S oxidoreductase